MVRMSAPTGFAAFAMLTASLTWSPAIAAAQDPARTFPSAQAASHALVVAVQGNDQQTLTEILGGNTVLITTGDDNQDRTERQLFVQKYRQMHRWMTEPDGRTMLYVGAENWPFPVPLVSSGGGWSFDSRYGEREIAMRRIGENELTAMQVGRELIRARTAVDPRLAGPMVPVGIGADARAPLHGYHFRALAGQGPNAAAYVAYPAEYRSSGVMTFLIGPDGVVHQRDLGPRTGVLAAALRNYEPDGSWRRVR